jgi:hypothetical protein
MYRQTARSVIIYSGDFMADIAMCEGADEKRNLICPMRDTCYRFTAPVNEYRQSYFIVVPYEAPECAEFWDNRGYNE